MHAILEDFFYGNIHPEELPIPKTPKYTEAIEKIVNLEQELASRLSESDYKLFEQYKEQHGKMETIVEKTRFVHGWKLGTQFTLSSIMQEWKDKNF